MKLKHGLPSDWSSACLGKLARLQAGGTPDRKEPSYWGGDIPWVGTAGINFNWIDQPSECITKEGLASSSAKVFPSGTILMAMIGQGVTRGKVATLRIEAATNQNCVGIVPSDKIDSRFLFHFLASRYSAIRGFGNSGGVSNMNASMIREIEVPIPPLCEGRKVGEIFDLWDRAIELTEKLIAAKQKRKQALMQQLLTGKVRLPGFGKSKWKQCHLDDVAKNSTRRNGVPTDDRTVYSVTNSVGMVPMDEGIIGESIDRYKTVSRFDFAYNPMRINVGSIAMWDGDKDVLVSPDYVVFRCSSMLDAQFLNHFRRTHYWRHFVTRAGGGSVRVRIYFSDLGSMNLNLPPVEEQKAIAEILNVQDSEINLLSRRLDALKRQKKGLMQQLLTGRVRVVLSEVEDSHVKC